MLRNKTRRRYCSVNVLLVMEQFKSHSHYRLKSCLPSDINELILQLKCTSVSQSCFYEYIMVVDMSGPSWGNSKCGPYASPDSMLMVFELSLPLRLQLGSRISPCLLCLRRNRGPHGLMLNTELLSRSCCCYGHSLFTPVTRVCVCVQALSPKSQSQSNKQDGE